MTRVRHSVAASLLALSVAAWPAGAATITITKADCDRLVKHVPDADVAYAPGVDVYGREVVPADLDGGIELALPEEILIDIDVDLFERFGIPANGANFDADAIIGTVVYRDDRFTFNGQPLQSEEEAALAERCQEIRRGEE